MATLVERRKGVWFAREFVPGVGDMPPRQVGRAPSAVNVTVAELLDMWQAAKAHEWQPTTVREHRSRAAWVAQDLGKSRLRIVCSNEGRGSASMYP